MLRLTGLARRSVLLRLPASHATRSAIIARPLVVPIRRLYSSDPQPNHVRWTPAQKTFVLGLLTKINTAPVMEALMKLGPEKAGHFMELLQEISEDGARDSLSIGRVLAFLNTNDIDLNSVKEQDYAEELREDEVLPSSEKIPRLSREEVIALAKEEGSPPEELEALSKLTDEELDALHEEALQSMTEEVPEEEPAHEIPGGPAGEHRWPNLMERDPLMDSRDVLDIPATTDMPFHNRVVIRNHESMFHEAMRLEAEMDEQADEIEFQGENEADSEFDDAPEQQVQAEQDERLSADEVEDLMENKGDNAFVYKYASPSEATAKEGSPEAEGEEGEYAPPEGAQTFTETDITSPTPDIYNRTGISKNFDLRDPDIHVYEYYRMAKQQTGKGKIARAQIFVIIGNGDGLIGFGKGTHAEYMRAKDKAYAQAIRNIDYVDRFEDRTVWTTLEDKFGSAKIIIRPRPLGFGLRCGPTLHKVFRAAGISDISAKIWKSRNRLVVTQGALRMLQAGHNPLGKGNGAGARRGGWRRASRCRMRRACPGRGVDLLYL
ncbi:hypothetical protein CPB85DRAFT_1255996 [Mucidula mucida]|nr:hypothetical protein CPB85DRAFT_1255996 [Mucidula mucida]